MRNRVSLEELDYTSDGLYCLDGNPFTGVVEHFSNDGWIEVEEEYQDGLLSGVKREWHRQGVLRLEAACAFGARHGRCREWDDSSRLVAEEFYEFGIRVTGKRWNAEGILVEEFAIGETDPGYQLLQTMRHSLNNHE